MLTWLKKLFQRKGDNTYSDGTPISREITEEEYKEMFPCNEKQLKYLKAHYRCVGNSRKGKSWNHKRKKNCYGGDQVIHYEKAGQTLKIQAPFWGFACEHCGKFGSHLYIFKIGKEYMCQHCAVTVINLSHLE